jgi:hypothetical protein
MLPGLLETRWDLSNAPTSIGQFIIPNASMDQSQTVMVATNASECIGAEVVRAFC